MATLTQHNGTLDMLTAQLVDHAAQAAVLSPSTYSWLNSNFGAIIAYSVLDDITYNATSPLSGTVAGITAYNMNTLLYDAAGLSGSLVSMAGPFNLEAYWQGILAGETTIVLNGSAEVYGDQMNVTIAVAGAADRFEIGGATNGAVRGDAWLVTDTGFLTGGSDTFIVDGVGGLDIIGDATSVVGGLQGGNDTFSVVSAGTSLFTIVGDAVAAQPDPTPASQQAITGGHDTISVNGSIGSLLYATGDFRSVDSRSVVGGNDTIDAGTAQGAVIYGDVETIGAGSVLTAGDDVIQGSLIGPSTIWGDGTTMSTIAAECGNDIITGGAAGDTIYGDIQTIEGSPALHTQGHDLIRGAGGNDTIEGQVGNDTVDGGRGNDSLNGGNGAGETNTVTFDSVNIAVFVDLSAGLALGQGFDTIAFFANVTGSSRADTIGGDAQANAIVGGAGNDTLSGRAGADTLNGGGGIDLLVGGADGDTYVNPTGDSIVEQAGGGIDTVQSNATFSLEALVEVENLTLTGSAATNGTGNAAANTIIGNNAVNILVGGNGDDSLVGGGGKDQLTGGRNNDTMDGGSAADTFRFAVLNTGNDRILNFEYGLDKFDLTGGEFSQAQEISGNTRLTHAGGTVTIMGITGKTLNQWNAQVLPSGGTASIPADPPLVAAEPAGFPWQAVTPALSHPAFAHAGDWFWA